MKFRILFILLAFFGGYGIYSQSRHQAENVDGILSSLSPESVNSLTIYVIPSKVKYDWSSPRALYRSYVRNYKRNIFSRKSYLLGHAFVELRSPLIPGKIQAGMRSTSPEENKQYVFKEKYGLAILGADLKGRLETGQELEHIKDKYARKGRLAYIRFLVSDEAAERMIEFFRTYTARFDTAVPGSVPYGGSFWPRYRGEGSGCSAFVVSFMDVAGLLREEYDGWKVDVDIPMELIGGPYNPGREVKINDIRKYEDWASSQTEHEPYMIYDPTLMFEWVEKAYAGDLSLDGLSVEPIRHDKVIGIRIDSRDIPVPSQEEIILEREEPSIFIDYYFQKSTPEYIESFQ